MMRYYYESDGTVVMKASVRGSVIQPISTLPWVEDARDLDESLVRVDMETLALEILPAE